MFGTYDTAGDVTDDTIIRRMRIECWITKANTLRRCNTYCFSMATVVTRTQINVTFICTLPVLFTLLPYGKYSISPNHPCRQPKWKISYLSIRVSTFSPYFIPHSMVRYIYRYQPSGCCSSSTTFYLS